MLKKKILFVVVSFFVVLFFIQEFLHLVEKAGVLEAGTYTDMVGVVVSFVAFLGLLCTLRQQSETLKKQEEELDFYRKAETTATMHKLIHDFYDNKEILNFLYALEYNQKISMTKEDEFIIDKMFCLWDHICLLEKITSIEIFEENIAYYWMYRSFTAFHPIQDYASRHMYPQLKDMGVKFPFPNMLRYLKDNGIYDIETGKILLLPKVRHKAKTSQQ